MEVIFGADSLFFGPDDVPAEDNPWEDPIAAETGATTPEPPPATPPATRAMPRRKSETAKEPEQSSLLNGAPPETAESLKQSGF